ncbi:hypothetical protein [Serratia sp. 2723]|uniref:hypothetical protein n=1 Tax=unclassified Serratia (in: enterobacteria) TaxID=2647522 RepID=UPI003D208F25
MRELSKVEMQEVSGAGFWSDLMGNLTTGAEGALKGLGSIFVETGKVFTDFVFNAVKGFWEGRYNTK